MTRSSGYGYNASAISLSLTSGPYESAVSMKLTPSSTARRRTRLASSRSLGSPRMYSPVIRIAPNPRRLTVKSPPTSIVPAAAAGDVLTSGSSASLSHSLRRTYAYTSRAISNWGASRAIGAVRRRSTGWLPAPQDVCRQDDASAADGDAGAVDEVAGRGAGPAAEGTPGQGVGSPF